MDELLKALVNLLWDWHDEVLAADPKAEAINIFVMSEEEQAVGLKDQDVPCVVLMPSGEQYTSGPAAGVGTRTINIKLRIIDQAIDMTKYRSNDNYFNIYRKSDAILAKIHTDKNLGIITSSDEFVYGKKIEETVVERSDGYFIARDIDLSWVRWQAESGQRNDDIGLNVPNTKPYDYTRTS